VKLIVLGPPIENDLSGQLNVVEDLINRGVQGLAIAPVDSTGIVPVVKKANEKNIPVVALDTAIEGGKVVSFAATDNLKAAAIQARAVAKAIGGKGKVVLINGSQAQQTGRDRRTGFLKTMKKEYPGIKVLEVQTKWDATAAANGLQDLLNANSDVTAVANAWDGATVADIPVLKSKGLTKKVFLIGFDGAPDAIAQMQKGNVQADVAQQLYQIGYQGITAAVKSACGQKVPARIDTGQKLLTPANLNAFIESNPPVLHTFIKKAGGK
jgi:ribose transport system substrate-binding protein